MHGDRAIMDREVAKHLEAWEAAGRTSRPYLMHNLYFALGDDAPGRLEREPRTI